MLLQPATVTPTDRFSQRNLSLEGGTLDIMVAYLTPDGYLRRELDEAARSKAAAASAEGLAADDGAAPAEGEGESAAVPVALDFKWLSHRSTRVTGAPIAPVRAGITDDNRAMLLITMQPATSALSASLIDLSTGPPRQIFAISPAGLTGITISPGGSKIYLLHRNAIATVTVASGASASVPFSLQAAFNPVAEMKCLFEHHWRFVQSKFHDAGMHGVDWPAMRKVYARYLPHISHWEDFVELMDELQGELNASHLKSRFTGINPDWDQTAELGLYFDTTHEGPGARIADTPPGGPAALVGSPYVEGALILAVDGTGITADADIFPLLNRKAGRVLRLTVQPADGGTPVDVPVRAAAPGANGELVYQRWVDRRRAMVEQFSGGRLGCTHVRKMEDESFRQVYSDLMGPARNKEGAIVDTRFNLGGNLHDQLTSFLTGTRHSGLFTRSGVDIGSTPYIRWAKPTALLVNTFNYPDASAPWSETVSPAPPWCGPLSLTNTSSSACPSSRPR